MSDINLSILNQDTTWTDASGTVHQIADMEPRYCRNVVAFLERRVDQIAILRSLSMTRTRLPDEDTQAYLDVTGSIDREYERMADDPLAWLNDQPLLKALRVRATQGD